MLIGHYQTHCNMYTNYNLYHIIPAGLTAQIVIILLISNPNVFNRTDTCNDGIIQVQKIHIAKYT